MQEWTRGKNRKKKSVIDWAQKIKKKKSKRVRHGLPKNVTLQKKQGKGNVCPYSMESLIKSTHIAHTQNDRI
jgi:hypothetical protein